MSATLLGLLLAAAPPQAGGVELVYRKQGAVGGWVPAGSDFDVHAVITHELLSKAARAMAEGDPVRARIRLSAARRRSERSRDWGLRLLVADEVAEYQRRQGDLLESWKTYWSALGAAAVALGKDDPRLAPLHANMAAVLEDLDRVQDALDAYRESLRLLEDSDRGATPEADALRATLAELRRSRPRPPAH